MIRTGWLMILMSPLAYGGDDAAPDPAATLAALTPARTAVDTGTRYLAVFINGQPTARIAGFTERPGALYIQAADLAELGIDPGRVPALYRQPSGAIDLSGVPGVHYHIDESQQRIDLDVPESLRTPAVIGARPPSPPAARAATGLVVNYDAFAQDTTAAGAPGSLALASEQRLFSPIGVLEDTGIVNAWGPGQRYVREDSFWRYDNQARFTTLQAGDSISSSLSWTRPVRLGGLQLRRNFSLAPELITFPLPQLAGSAALPSSVDLYVNGVRQFSTDVPAGPFVTANLPVLTGAGLATLTVRDALGRAVSTTLPVYIDSRLLAAGLNSYSIEAGWLRYGYGLQPFDYHGPAALSGSVRAGVSDSLTLEGHAEATAGLGDAGLGALWRVASCGVMNAALALSDGTGRPGLQGSLGYQLITQRFSLTLQSQRAQGSYRDLAALSGTPPPRALDQLILGVNGWGSSTFGASLVHIDDSVAGRSAIGALWVSVRLGSRLVGLVNASEDFEQRRARALWLGFSLDLGNRIVAAANAGTRDGRPLVETSVARSADYDGGWEWSAQSDHEEGVADSLARGGYLGRYGEVSAIAQQAAGEGDFAFEAVGGLVWMDGFIGATRRVDNAFALVSTDGVADVPVLHENRPFGITDSSGHLLVPDLNAYEHNRLAIDPLVLPANVRVPADRLDVTPYEGSGVLAHFPIERYRAALLILIDDQGHVLPAGTELVQLETGDSNVVGYDGEAFIEHLHEHNRLRAHGAGIDCEAQFDYMPPDAGRGELANLGRVICRAPGGARP
jgi:outer membrane usher protein